MISPSLLRGTAAVLAVAGIVRKSTVEIPKPSGPYGVEISSVKLIDLSRLDPFAPVQQNRAVVISVFLPAELTCCAYSPQDYLPLLTATFEDQSFAPYGIPSGTFESLVIQACHLGRPDRRYLHLKKYPVILFSPALGTTRLFYSAIAQSVASFGYAVIIIDHPYDADIVEFPDGSYVTSNISDSFDPATDPRISLAVKTRYQDASFVLDEISKESVTQLLVPGARCGFDTTRVGMFGHSLGGATTAAAMANDNRIVAGINFDGSFFGAGAITEDLHRPFLLFGSGGPPGHNLSTDPTWATVWKRLKGWKAVLSLKDAAHYTFSDLPMLVHVLGFRELLPPEATDRIGTLDGLRALEVLQTYVTAFFDRFLTGEDTGLLNGPSDEYPEVEFLAEGRKSDTGWFISL